ncbi:cell wall hydrolase [Sandaracinobacteroides sp. A072]|uniref:cell wall hydrolase n=1 Tax=Sandaracinobacteroides sp. A072 TaxID=3461146 RepID=UPI004043107F
MRYLARAAAVLGFSILLLAAGEAPNGDLAFLGDIRTEESAPALIPAVSFIEDSHTVPEPDIGPVVPEASNLADMVKAVRTLDGIVLDTDLKCLATAVYFESKGEPLEGQLAVAEVILNRVEDGRFGRDICSVVKAPYQFSFVRGGKLPAPRDMNAYETAEAIAVIAASASWQEVVGGATHFHARYVNPRWKLQRVAAVGQHIFYR